MSSRNTRIYERGQVFSLWLRDHVIEHPHAEQQSVERQLVLDSLELVGALLLAAVFPADSKEHFTIAQRTLTRLRMGLQRATETSSITGEVAIRAYSEIAALDRMLRGQRANARTPDATLAGLGAATRHPGFRAN